MTRPRPQVHPPGIERAETGLRPRVRRLGLRACLPLAVLVAGCARQAADRTPREFENQWHALLARRQFAQAERLIQNREKRHPDDPEVFVARGNLYFRMARGVPHLAPTPGASGTAADSGAVATDTLLARRAVETLADAVRRFPNRLDIRFGLAYVEQELGQTDAEVAVLRDAVAYAREHPADLRWSYGEPLPGPPERYVPSTLHDYVTYYMDHPGHDATMLAIANLAGEAYPHWPYALNDIAYYYGARGDWTQCLAYLGRAYRADSTDALVLYNLGWAYENTGRRAQALHWYQRSLIASQAGSVPEIAKDTEGRIAVLTGHAAPGAAAARATPILSPRTAPLPSAAPVTLPPPTSPTASSGSAPAASPPVSTPATPAAGSAAPATPAAADTSPPPHPAPSDTTRH